MRYFRTALVLALAALAAACGRKGPIMEPLTRVPKSVEALAAGQRGGHLFLQWTPPKAFIDGRALPPGIRTEIWLMRNDAEAALLPLEWEDEDDFMNGAVLLGVYDAYGRPFDEAAATVPPAPDSSVPEILRWEGDMAGADAAAARLVFGVRVRAGKRGDSKFAYAAWTPRAMPSPPSGLRADVFEDRVEISWTVPAAPAEGKAPPSVKGYNVYRSSPGREPVRLNETPVEAPPFADRSFTFGVAYSYRVRALTGDAEPYLESDESDPLELTPADSFPPAPPTGLISVTAVGLITLSWNPAPEADVAGYRVWRGGGREGDLKPLTRTAIPENTFSDDRVEAGRRYRYAVSAVDRAGNESALSETLAETGRGGGA